MRVEFDLNNICWNSNEAGIRESMRMLCLAWCMGHLGHTVGVSGLRPAVAKLHSRMKGSIGGPDVLVVPERALLHRMQRVGRKVAFKTSIDCSRDEWYLEHCELLVAHENHVSVTGHENLLPVPFMVSGPMMRFLFDDGMGDHYLLDDLWAIRKKYGAANKLRKVGHCGSSDFGRAERAAQMPGYCEFRWVPPGTHHENYLPPPEYLKWISECEAGVFFSGDTPKSYRWSELALMGVPIVTVPLPVATTPLADENNTIQLSHWNDKTSLDNGLKRTQEIRQAADVAYLAGWSPMGQAKLILERIGA